MTAAVRITTDGHFAVPVGSVVPIAFRSPACGGPFPAPDQYIVRWRGRQVAVNITDAEEVDVTAPDRDETDACQRGTDGCSIDHDTGYENCETW